MNYFLGYFSNIFQYMYHKKQMTQKLQCKYLVLYFAKKKEMQIIKCIHFLYFSQKLQHRKPTYTPR